MAAELQSRCGLRAFEATERMTPDRLACGDVRGRAGGSATFRSRRTCSTACAHSSQRPGRHASHPCAPTRPPFAAPSSRLVAGPPAHTPAAACGLTTSRTRATGTTCRKGSRPQWLLSEPWQTRWKPWATAVIVENSGVPTSRSRDSTPRLEGETRPCTIMIEQLKGTVETRARIR